VYFSRYLKRQLEIASKCKLPLFLHCRAAAADLVTVLQEQEGPHRGVVHSFDGSLQEAEAFIALGLHIGINGW
jgi:TatD DNase family protein